MRNLAYRMGRTIRQYRALQKRTSKPSALTRNHLNAALDEWKVHVKNVWDDEEARNDVTVIPVKLGKPNGVIERVDVKNKNKDSECTTTVFKEIRDGIIDDMVKNRVMLYPSRRALYTDRHRFMGEFYERANIWSWGSEPIRQRHSPYRRERYFDMRRWPLNRQPNEEMRTKITTRADEDPDMQAVSGFYKYNIKVGPVPMIPAQSDVVSKLIHLLGDPDKEIVAEQLIHSLSKEVVKIVKQVNEASGTGWEFRVAPPGARIAGTVNKTANITSAITRLRPIVRPKQIFIPGPAVFPMGDTLLQQVKLSQDLERILDPKPTGVTSSFTEFFRDWLAPAERVPLLPEIDLSKTPSTSRLNLKRKVNTAFVTADGRAPKKQKTSTLCSQGSRRSNNVDSGGGRGHPSDSGTGPESDTDTHMSDILGYDHVIPARGNTSQSKKRKDDTFQVNIETDLEDVMKMNISRRKTNGRKINSGGKPVINFSGHYHRGDHYDHDHDDDHHGETTSFTSRPNARVRRAHIQQPIIHYPSATPAPVNPIKAGPSVAPLPRLAMTSRRGPLDTSSTSKSARIMQERTDSEYDEGFPNELF
ncbi:hypothetical protein BKA67DRAFT_554269 [Truncatella angustata]|uniref:Uncharacterized protein n=1 Tax=Truncatella angustata TaxID=152316 RepID=A0A9P9A1L9_9PEZI|nr:uncharacterized protein BKA67DRAFT_554269 [Truncatella angustata]KAH6657110.1 hypothetical protein BKA67DRAFT_554269 [Truncatella angustata]